MKKILITGGEGFIGSHLRKSLEKKGNQVVIVGKNASNGEKEIKLNLLEHTPEKKLTESFDVVIHLASIVAVDEGIKKPKETILNNLCCTLNILEDMKLNNPNGLLIFASSDKIYGDPPKDVVTEDDEGKPLEPYGCSKLLSEQLIQTYHHIYGINYIIIRSGNVFGPGQGPDLFIPYVCSEIAKGEDNVFVGNLDCVKNFIYIDDLIDMYVSCLENEQAKNNVFNIKSYHKKIIEVTKEIAAPVKEKLRRDIIFVQKNERMRDISLESKPFIMDCTKVRQILNWCPKNSFSEAIRKTVKSYLDKNNAQNSK